VAGPGGLAWAGAIQRRPFEASDASRANETGSREPESAAVWLRSRSAKGERVQRPGSCGFASRRGGARPPARRPQARLASCPASQVSLRPPLTIDVSTARIRKSPPDRPQAEQDKPGRVCSQGLPGQRRKPSWPRPRAQQPAWPRSPWGARTRGAAGAASRLSRWIKTATALRNAPKPMLTAQAAPRWRRPAPHGAGRLHGLIPPSADQLQAW